MTFLSRNSSKIEGLIKEDSLEPQRSVNSRHTWTRGLGTRGPGRTTTVNRRQKGIRASETERNRVFVALLPGSRLGPPLSARVCPAQTLFLQIEPHVPPFTLYPFSFAPSFTLSPSPQLSVCLFLSFFLPSPLPPPPPPPPPPPLPSFLCSFQSFSVSRVRSLLHPRLRAAAPLAHTRDRW